MRINKMNLEKKASVSGVIKDLWKNTKELPKNFKEYNKIRKSLKQDIKNLDMNDLESVFSQVGELYGKKELMLSHLKNIKKGLVIPTAAGVGVGAGSYGGYKYIKNKQEKTAGLKDYWKATKNLTKDIDAFLDLKKIKRNINYDKFRFDDEVDPILEKIKNKEKMEYRKEFNPILDEMINFHLNKIKKGLVIPTVGLTTSGAGSYGAYRGYKYIKNKQEKTAGFGDYWKDTKNLINNIKAYRGLKDIVVPNAKGITELEGLKSSIRRGLVIPAAGVGAAGVAGIGGYKGYKQLKSRQEKTAGLLSDTKNLIKNIKEYRKLNSSLPSDYFEHRKLIEGLKKSIMRGLVIPGAALGITGAGGTYIYKKTKQPAGVKDYLKTTKKINKDIYKKMKQSVDLKNYWRTAREMNENLHDEVDNYLKKKKV
jgi:hypothetical protein